MNSLNKYTALKTNTAEKVPEQAFKMADSCHCSCDDNHGHSYDNDLSLKKQIMQLVPGCGIYTAALVLDLPEWISFILFFTSYLLIAWDVLFSAIKNILRGQVFDEFFLMTIATLGAFAIKEFPEAVAVMLFFKVGELFQDFALNRSRRSIKALLEIRPDYANIQFDGGSKKVDPGRVNVGDIILVKPGERVPLDGIVMQGSSMMDTAALTGESAPRSIKPEDEVLSGMINQTGLLIVFALSVKDLFLFMGALGFVTMWEAVFADVGVALLAILNSTRILK